MMDSLNFEVSTKFFPDGRIEQELVDIRGRIMRQVIDTQDQQIKEALIKLGWTPPDKQEADQQPKEARMSKPEFYKNYARSKLELVLRDLDHYTAEEFWREINRITSGATGLPSAEQLQARVKELEAINLGLTKTLVEMEAENAGHCVCRFGQDGEPITTCLRHKRQQGEVEKLKAENTELRNRGAVYYGLQKDEGRLLVNVDTEQLEIYDSLRAAQLARSLGQTVVRVRVRRDDEGEA